MKWPAVDAGRSRHGRRLCWRGIRIGDQPCCSHSMISRVRTKFLSKQACSSGDTIVPVGSNASSRQSSAQCALIERPTWHVRVVTLIKLIAAPSDQMRALLPRTPAALPYHYVFWLVAADPGSKAVNRYHA